MYSLATILLIGSAAALTLKKNETVDMAQVEAKKMNCWIDDDHYEHCSPALAQVNATHDISQCEDYHTCSADGPDRIACDDRSLQDYCQARC